MKNQNPVQGRTREQQQQLSSGSTAISDQGIGYWFSVLSFPGDVTLGGSVSDFLFYPFPD